MFWNFVWNKKNCQSKKKIKNHKNVKFVTILFPRSSRLFCFGRSAALGLRLTMSSSSTSAFLTWDRKLTKIKRLHFFFFLNHQILSFFPLTLTLKKNLFPRSSLLLRCVLKQKKWDNNCKKIKQKQQQQQTSPKFQVCLMMSSLNVGDSRR